MDHFYQLPVLGPPTTSCSSATRRSPRWPRARRRCAGAGWFELEHRSLGFEFGTFTDRFEKLEEALQIIIPMLAGDRPSFTGKHYVVDDAINQPPPVGRIPVMIGGSGERKTLRMVAQYADESNLTCGPDEVGERLEAVRASGVDGVTCNLVANGHLPGRIELLGGAATAVFS
jgi:hypothetical protein